MTGSISKIGLALSKRPHFNRAYLVIGRYSCSETVYLKTPKFLSLSGYATGSQELLIKTSIEESPNANKARMIKSL